MTKLNNFVLNEIEAQMSLTKNADMQTWKMGTTLLVLMIVSITSIITQKSAILQRVAKSCPSWQKRQNIGSIGAVSQKKEELMIVGGVLSFSDLVHRFMFRPSHSQQPGALSSSHEL